MSFIAYVLVEASSMAIRAFTSQLDDQGDGRPIDDDAPPGLRQEFIDAAFHVLQSAPNFTDGRPIYDIVAQSLGVAPSRQPYAGFRHAIGRDLSKADWQRVYDLICRLWPEVVRWDMQTDYRAAVNRILAAYRVAWDLGEDGQLHRVLPPAAQSQIEAAFRELSRPAFGPALQLFRDAMTAYDDRPRRDRDTCCSIFDALESVAKAVFEMPTKTFGDVLAEVCKRQAMSPDTIAVLQKLYDMANNHFRHGMTTPWTLKVAEVDFCIRHLHRRHSTACAPMNEATEMTFSPSPLALPVIVTTAGRNASERFLEFFAGNIRNQHTRRAYAQATREFLACCGRAGVASIADVRPLHVAAYIEQLGRERSAPTVKQRLAAIRHLFDWLVTGRS
jgi:hypothetical protein